MAEIIRNWGYMGPNTPNRRYDTTVGQLMNGFPVGILQLWAHLPFFPGNVSNAWTYDFPVKFMGVKDSGIDNILAGDMPPYARRIQAELNLPVYDAFTLIKYAKSTVAQMPYYGFL